MRFAGRAWPVLSLLVALLLAGCASLEPLLTDLSGKPPTAPTDLEGPAAPTQPDVYTLEVQAPEPLRRLLARYLDLARFRDAREAGAVTRLELDRLIAAAPAQARSIAETEGFFDAEVSVARDRADVPRVTVTVVPGPRARIDDIGIAVTGALFDASQAADEVAIDTSAMLLEQWPLQRGAPFSQAGWSSAKSGTLARLQAQGYPAARLEDSSAVVDTETRKVRLHVKFDSGPLFRLGTLRIVGLSHYDEAAVHNLLDFAPGEVYTEALLAQWQRHLQKSELFEAALVELQVDPAKADESLVIVTVREMPRQQITAGVGYSSDTGARATLDYMHRRPFGWNIVASNKFEVGKEKNAWSAQLITHPLPNHYRDLASVDLERLDQDDELRTSASLRLGRNQDTDDRGRQVFFAVQSATVESAAPKTAAQAASLNYNWVTRNIDSIALPTRGTVLAAQTAAGYTYRTLASTGVFARGVAALTGYHPFGEVWNLQWRVEAGEVFAKSAVGVPDTLLFRAGGQDSVRGYGYRRLGPVVNGAVTSGRMLFTSSLEIARPILSGFPSLWGAVFVDAGNAANRWQDLKPVVGVGPGLRWRSPVGALRVDLAYAVDGGRWRLEVSLGIAP